jgi:chromosome partitioning protein
MAYIITVANEKGGSAKTTTALNLAGAFAESSKRVLVVDGDPQGTASYWRGMRPEADLPFTVVSMAQPTIHKQLPQMLENSQYDFALVDCPPGGPRGEKNITRSACACADMILVPMSPSPADLWSFENMQLMLDMLVSQTQKRFVCRILISRKIPNTKLGRDAHLAASSFGVEICETEITQRVGVAESLLEGKTVIQYAPQSAAAEEFRKLAKEVIGAIKEGKPYQLSATAAVL